jgi:predicted dehydrogenase
MPDLEAVTIETFDLNLVKYAQMAVDRGLHVHMDKAAGENAEAFERLLSSVKAKKLVFNMGYMYRYNPCIMEAFERVKAGEIGKIYSIDAEMSCYYDKDKREWLEQFQGGMMQYLGCHLIDLVVRLQGVPEEIIPYNCASGADGVTAKDVAFAVLKYPDGVSTVKSTMLDAGGFVRRHFSINGEKGSIEIRPLEHYEGGGTMMSTKMTTYVPEEGWHSLGHMQDSGAFERYEAMLLAFATMIREEKAAVVDLETEARVQRCLLAADGIACDYKAEIKL